MSTTGSSWQDTATGLTSDSETIETGPRSASADDTSQEFAEFTLQEIITLQQENHVASQELRRNNRVMVNKRLAKEISSDQFHAHRKETAERQAFLHGRHQKLGAEIQRQARVRDVSRTPFSSR